MQADEEIDWSDVANVADLIAERDAAKEEARKARMEQANAVADLAEARAHLTKGVLFEARRQARRIGGDSAMEVVTSTAKRFGVTL
ncbi:hypothetical protein [Leucobacter luti]|uniref:hypothetical protein n=1 Tax=Leucobacter luti TaxID=340320 RepID=UPI003D000093